MKKSTREYLISSEKKNANGFHVRTAGIDLVDYNANPLMLWMHKRPKGESKEEILPPGNMVDLNFADNKLMGTPSFDEDDAFALSLYNKYENGTLRAVSPGLIPLEWGKDEAGNIWLEKSRLKEVSLVDIGSNAEALGVTLYDENDDVINLSLSDIQTILKPDNNMKLIQLSALAILPLLKLKDDATPEEAQAAIGTLVTLAETQATEIGTLKTEKEAIELKYNEQVKLVNDTKIATLLDANEGKRFLAGDRPKWEKLLNTDFEGTKELLLAQPEFKSAASQMKNGEDANAEILNLSYDELDKKNLLVTLKAQNPEIFKEKFKTKFNKEYKEN